MKQRSAAAIALAASVALLLASGGAWAVARTSDVGDNLEQVTAAAGYRADNQLGASRQASRPQTSAPAAPAVSPQPGEIPVRDASEIVIPDPALAPQEVSLDSIGVTMPIVATGVQDDGQMELPDDPRVLGWYEFGPAPGDDAGSAVLGGHVDSIDLGTGPLSRLSAMAIGDSITVTDGTGAPVAYRVVTVERIIKGALPVDTLFAPDGPHQLAVVTCGGRYLPDAGGYEDNIVVIAEPVAP